MHVQKLATILAALRFYQRCGLADDPCKRSDEVHAIATENEELISLDSAGVNELFNELCTPVRATDVEASVHVGYIDHVQGELLRAFGTRDECYAWLASWCRENWGGWFDLENPAEASPPDNEAAVRMYFERADTGPVGIGEFFRHEEQPVKLQAVRPLVACDTQAVRDALTAVARLLPYDEESGYSKWEGDTQLTTTRDGEDAMHVLNYHIQQARKVLKGMQPDATPIDDDPADPDCTLCNDGTCPWCREEKRARVASAVYAAKNGACILAGTPSEGAATFDPLEDEEADDQECSNCGDPLDDGEGYDGLCGNCADVVVEAMSRRGMAANPQPTES